MIATAAALKSRSMASDPRRVDMIRKHRLLNLSMVWTGSRADNGGASVNKQVK